VTRIGIDVGGTKCLGVVLDDDGTIIHALREPTPDGSQIVGTLCEMVRDLIRDTKHADTSTDSVSVGVGVPGLVTFDGVFRASPHISNVVNMPLARLLSDQLQISVRVENDATAAMYSEWIFGAARGVSDALMITLGTGIGGGVVMGGHLQRGSHGHAGEFGHIVVERDGRQCACGQRGCWETYASGSALRAMSGGMDGQEVMSRALQGDHNSQAVVETYSEWVALGVGTLVNICDPKVIVIGGGVVQSGQMLIDHVSRHLPSYVYSHLNRDLPPVVPAALGENAGAIGSALLGALQ
jgi:glucokinase